MHITPKSIVYTIGLFSLILLACKPENKNSNSSNGIGSYQDQLTAYSIISSISFLYNQHLAGTPTGNKNSNISCPNGGTTTVTGTTATDSSTSINRVDLTWTQDNCHIIDKEYDITTTGEIKENGSWRNTTVIQEGFRSKTYTSSKLKALGTVSKNARTYNIDIDCAITINVSSSTVSGTICERHFSFNSSN